MVNKIPTELDNPIDVVLYNQVDRDLEFYKKIGLTPNGLTTISLILALTGIYNFYKDEYFLGALFFFIGYYFDCADGKMARKYKMFSKYGDLYDHYSDLIKIGLLYYTFYKKSTKKFKLILIISIFLLLLCNLFITCQEELYGKKHESKTLDYFNIKLDNCEEKIKYFKYFAPGTCIVFLTLCILLWNKF